MMFYKMIVTNVIIVIFFVIIFVTYAASTDKQRLGLKKEQIGKVMGHKLHDDNVPDILFRALSDFGVSRRSSNSVPFEKHIDEPKHPKAENKKRNIIEKLKSSVIFRDNILYIFSYLLHGREDGLTEEQYTSLQMLYDILRRRMVYLYNLLPVLSKLENTDKNQQTRIVLLSLTKNLPPYLQCAAKFLANEIQQRNIDLETLLRPTKTEVFNYLAGINADMIFRSKVKFIDEEVKGYDKYSNITQKALGPVFVRLLDNLHTNNLSLSQELFGLILMNLPNPDDDPVLEENIRYLYEVTKNNLIMNWDLIGKDPINRDVYTLVFSVLSKIFINSNTGIVVKNAAVYVYNHLKLVAPTYANPNLKYMHNLIKQNIDMRMLLAPVIPHEFDADAISVKERLLIYFTRNHKNKDLGQALKGFNRFGYRDPLDLLLALLTRILNRIPASKVDILQPAATLLSALILKRHVRTFTPFVSPEVDVLILLESLKNPDLNPMLSQTVDSIKFELIAQPRLLMLLSTLIPMEKAKCFVPRQCLMNTFQQMQKLQGNIPITLATKIQNMMYILKSMQRYQPQSFSMQYSMIPGDIDLHHVNQENPIIVIVKAYSPHAQNVPIGLNGSPYVWNIGKYISETDLAMQDRSSETLEREQRVPVVIDSMDTKEVSLTTTIDQERITEYGPSRVNENSPDRSFTLNPSLTTTSASYVSSQVSYNVTPKISDINESTLMPSSYDIEQQSSESQKPSQKNPRKQLERKPMKSQTMRHYYPKYVTTEDTLEEGSSEIKYPHTIETISHETKNPYQLYPNNEVKTQIEDMGNLMKKSSEIETIYSTTVQKIQPTRKPRKKLSEKMHKIQEIISTSQKIPKTTIKYILKKHEKSQRTQENIMQNILHDSSSPESVVESTEETTENIEQFDERQNMPHIKPSTTIEETLDTENMSTAIIFPPFIKPDHPLAIQLSNNGVPVVTTDDQYNTTVPKLVLPGIKELLKSPNVNDLLGEIDTPIVEQVLRPLSVIFGKNYIQKILKEVDPKLYSTNIALLLAILKEAKNQPQVTENPELVHLIKKYIASIEYISPTILLPIVISLKKLVSDTVYSTFNPHDSIHSTISENPPDESSSDRITIPLINPKMWLQSINASDPYANLLPILRKGNAFEIMLRPLKKILTPEKIAKILGTDFNPLIYPNKGALLITLLHKLRKATAIQSNVALKSLIEIYIRAIELPSMNIHVSEDNFVKMMSESTGHWQPELTSLIYALPAAKYDAEIAMIEAIRHFLADPSLLEKLHIAKPPLTMSRGELLRKIISSALSDNMHLEKQTLKALGYYKDKVKFTDMGALPIMWIWVQVYVVKAEVKLGDMIQKMLDFNKLTYKEKLAYNELIIYLAQNPHLLQNNEDFAFEKYKTQGKFVKALFRYFLKKSQISNKIKTNIQMLLPRVMLSGPGAIAMPNFSLSF